MDRHLPNAVSRIKMAVRARPSGLARSLVLMLWVCLAMSLSGCTTSTSWNVLSDHAALPADTILAVYASRQSHDSSMSGYVLLFDSHGKVSAVKTSGMNIADLVWDEQGLFFSDTNQDYLMTDTGMKTWDSPKTNVQESAYITPDGIHVSMYNLGFGDVGAEMGYIEQIVETSQDDVTRYDVAGFATMTAQCGSRIFSISEVVEPYTSLAEQAGATRRDSPAPYWPDMLTQVYPKPATVADGFKGVNLTSYGGFAHGSVCRDDQILAITGGQNETPRIVTWPVYSGNPVQHEITGPNNEQLALDAQIAGFGRIAQWSQSTDELVWYGGDGLVRSTNIDTGRTTTIWDSGTPQIQSTPAGITFNESKLYILDSDERWSPNREMRLRVHDLATGITVEVFRTRIGYEQRDPTLVLRGMATPPGGR